VTYYESRIVSGPFDEVVEEVLTQLDNAGFEVLGDVDLRETFAEALDLPGGGRYRVIDTYNPSVAGAETADEVARRVLLPAKVVVYENDDGETVVAVADSGAVFSEDEDPELEELAETVDQRLAQVLRSVTMETDVIEG
jgi:uncharacterized protein (DUF302 family)